MATKVFSIRLDDHDIEVMNECIELVRELHNIKLGNSGVMSSALMSYRSDLRSLKKIRQEMDENSYDITGDVGTCND